MWPWKRQPSTVDRLAADLAALTERVDAYVFSLDMYKMDVDDLADHYERGERVHGELKAALVEMGGLLAGVKRFALARGFGFDASAPSGGSPMSQKAAGHALRGKGD